MIENTQTLKFDLGSLTKVVIYSGIAPKIERILGSTVEVSTVGSYTVKGETHSDEELNYQAFEISISPNGLGDTVQTISRGKCVQSVQISDSKEPSKVPPVVRLPENVVYTHLKI